MGGNVIAHNKKLDKWIKAEKVSLKKVGRQQFVKLFKEVFTNLDKLFHKRYNNYLWKNKENFEIYLNGSSSFVFSKDIPDEEIIKYKEYIGDIDIIVPEEFKKELWELLDKLENKEIVKNVIYMGSNKPTIKSIGEQINSVFMVHLKDYKVAVQVDFEFLKVNKDGTPDEWAKFSHSSSFEDTKKGIKAVHHKYLIQSLIGGVSMRDDIVIATPASTPQKIRLKKVKEGDIPRMLKFSIGRGIRRAYEPLYNENGEIIKINGKKVYRELKTSESNYITIIKEIYKLAFRDLEDIQNTQNIKKFNSYIGIIDLIKDKLNNKQIERTFKRYIDKLWGLKVRGQELEPDNKELDFQVKYKGYLYFIEKIPFLKKYEKDVKKQIEEYYKTWKGRQYFKETINNIKGRC